MVNFFAQWQEWRREQVRAAAESFTSKKRRELPQRCREIEHRLLPIVFCEIEVRPFRAAQLHRQDCARCDRLLREAMMKACLRMGIDDFLSLRFENAREHGLISHI